MARRAHGETRQPAPAPRPFVAEELDENFNPFASPQAEDTRPSFAGMYQQSAEPLNVEYGGFFARWAASFLDGIITGIVRVVILIGLIFGTVGRGGSEQDEDSPAMMALGLMFYVIWLGIPWLYEALMVSSDRQATLGKMALGLKVTNLAGNQIGFGQASGRHFGKLALGLLFGLGFFMQAFDPKGQALHDKLAGCLVIKSR